MKTVKMEKIMRIGVKLNSCDGITAHVLLHGDTGCLCVIIEEEGREVYQSRAFLQNREKLSKILEDMQTMHRLIRAAKRRK